MPKSVTQVRCPNCRNPIQAEIQQLVDVEAEPSSKGRLLSGALNVVRCPVCGFEGQLPLPIVYHDRVGETKVRLWKDSLRTLQYIVQAIIYYNPIKIFLLMSIVCLAISFASLGIGIGFRLATGFMLGVGAFLVAIIVFALGLVADLLRQIMSK